MSEINGNFKIGDMVQLNSGGPLMTVVQVVAVGGPTTIATSWFYDGYVFQGMFPAEALKLHP